MDWFKRHAWKSKSYLIVINVLSVACAWKHVLLAPFPLTNGDNL